MPPTSQATLEFNPTSSNHNSRTTVAVLAMGVLLCGFAWSLMEGTQIGDSVEYMERAQALARGEEVIDSEAIRSFGFPCLLAPLFWMADLVGLQDFRPLVALLRCLEILFVVGTGWGVIRVARQLVPNEAALVAGALYFANPFVMRWSATPIADPASAFCIVWALHSLLRAEHRRGAFLGGLWIGFGILMAFKSLMLVIPLSLMLIWKRKSQRRDLLLATALGVGLCLFAQCLIDWLYYGTFGESLWQYLKENVFMPIARWLHRFKFERAAQYIYNNFTNAEVIRHNVQSAAMLDESNITSRTGELWYWTQLHTAILPPALLCTLIGLATAIFKPSWMRLVFPVLILGATLATGWKGSKAYRLWLPLFPAFAVLSGLGYEVLRTRWAKWRATAQSSGEPVTWPAAVLLVLLTAGWAAKDLSGRDLKRFGGFWQAAEFVNQQAAQKFEAAVAADEPFAKQRFANIYHWGVLLRESEHVELVKLPHQLDGWPHLEEHERAESITALESLDWFVVHLPLLKDYPEVHAALNRSFEVFSVLHDDESFGVLGPLYVLKRNGDANQGRRFWTASSDTPQKVRELHQLPEPQFSFRKHRGDGTWQELTLLGFEWEWLPDADGNSQRNNGGQAWITYHWSGGRFDGERYVIVDRLVDHSANDAIGDMDEAVVWRNDHAPGYGSQATELWQDQGTLSESYAVTMPAAFQIDPASSARSLDLWIKVIGYGETAGSEAPREVTRLVPYPVVDGKIGKHAIEELVSPRPFPHNQPASADEAWVLNPELMVRVGQLTRVTQD